MCAAIRGLHSGGAADFVYFEKQGRDRLCGLHCVNNLLQGPLVTIDLIARVGQELDKKEAQLRLGGVREEAYRNISDDGFFSVTVLDSCLATQGFRMMPFNNPALGDLKDNPAKSRDGFICNLREHWFAIREVHSRWFSLNGLAAGPETVSEFKLASFIGGLVSQNWSVFVVRHVDWPRTSLPSPDPHKFPEVAKVTDPVAPLQGAAFLSFRAAFELHEIQDRHDRTSSGQVANPQPASLGSGQHNWPSHGGRILQENGIAEVERGGEDDELRQALVLSANQFKESLPSPPPEPSDGLLIKVNDPYGSAFARRFARTSTLKDLFTWVHKDPDLMRDHLPLLACQEDIKLRTCSFPSVTLRRILAGGIQGSPESFRVLIGRENLAENGENDEDDVTFQKISDHFPYGESLRLHCSRG